jgi:glycerol-3-phosphate dehydrogenase subunit B
MMDDDVVVVGGGLAGCLTALAAARTRSNVSVGLVTRAETTLEQASGLIDVLGYTPDGEGPIADPFEVLTDLPPAHPYSTVGVEAVREGLALFDEATGERYAGDDTDRNALVPTYGGRVKPTSRYPRSVEPGLASRRESTTVIGFEQVSGFYAPLASERLGEILPYRVDGLMIEFPRDVGGGADPVDTSPIECARTLDDNATDDSETVREGIVDSLEYYLDRKKRAGFPAVLGLTETESIREMLTEELGLPIFEVPMGPPSVPGRRLQSMLGEALSEAGVRVLTGASVVDVDASDGAVDRVRLDGDHEPYEASQFVLATGGLTGGGIRSDRE